MNTEGVLIYLADHIDAARMPGTAERSHLPATAADTMGPVTIWDDLTAEERIVMTTAIEEGYLNGVIGDFLGHSEHRGAIWIFSNDTNEIRALIPRFTAIVRGMIGRCLIEIREPSDGVWDNAPVLTMTEIDAVLADPRTWLWSADGNNRMVMTMTTDRADRLIGR